MKSHNEIAQWLKEQPWFGQFEQNIISDGHCPDAMTGCHGETTIANAFIWKSTPEGFDFWYKRTLELKTFCTTDNEEVNRKP